MSYMLLCSSRVQLNHNTYKNPNQTRKLTRKLVLNHFNYCVYCVLSVSSKSTNGFCAESLFVKARETRMNENSEQNLWQQNCDEITDVNLSQSYCWAFSKLNYLLQQSAVRFKKRKNAKILCLRTFLSKRNTNDCYMQAAWWNRILLMVNRSCYDWS